MKIERKLLVISVFELFMASIVFTAAVSLGSEISDKFRLWEIFPIFLSAFVTSFGIREMKRRT